MSALQTSLLRRIGSAVPVMRTDFIIQIAIRFSSNSLLILDLFGVSRTIRHRISPHESAAGHYAESLSFSRKNGKTAIDHRKKSSGFGSNMSMCAGPPASQIMMILFAEHF